MAPTPSRKKKVKPQDDPRNEWSKEHLVVSPDLVPGHYTVWLAATDVDGHTSKTGMSVCAWRICGEGSVISETWPGAAQESSEKKAYVAGVAGALDRLPIGSTAEIICRDSYIVDAINGGAKKWIAMLHPLPDERYPRQLYGLIWAHVLRAIKRIAPPSPGISARRPRKPNDEDDKVIETLKEVARNARPPSRR